MEGEDEDEDRSEERVESEAACWRILCGECIEFARLQNNISQPQSLYCMIRADDVGSNLTGE